MWVWASLAVPSPMITWSSQGTLDFLGKNHFLLAEDSWVVLGCWESQLVGITGHTKAGPGSICFPPSVPVQVLGFELGFRSWCWGMLTEWKFCVLTQAWRLLEHQLDTIPQYGCAFGHHVIHEKHMQFYLSVDKNKWAEFDKTFLWSHWIEWYSRNNCFSLISLLCFKRKMSL